MTLQWKNVRKNAFWERSSRNPNANPGSLLLLSIRREGEAGNRVLSSRLQQARHRVERPLCYFSRDGSPSFALLWAEIGLVRRTEGKLTREKWMAVSREGMTILNFIKFNLKPLTRGGQFKRYLILSSCFKSIMAPNTTHLYRVDQCASLKDISASPKCHTRLLIYIYLLQTSLWPPGMGVQIPLNQ